MRWKYAIYITGVFIFLGLLYFLMNDIFFPPDELPEEEVLRYYTKVEDRYYLWDKAKDVLLCGTILFLLRLIRRYENEAALFERFWWPIFIFLVIRFIWEIVAQQFNLNINLDLVGKLLFGVLLLSWFWIVILNFLKQWKQRHY